MAVAAAACPKILTTVAECTIKLPPVAATCATAARAALIATATGATNIVAACYLAFAKPPRPASPHRRRLHLAVVTIRHSHYLSH